MLLPTSDVAEAAARLRAAQTALDDATTLLGRAALLDWHSPAGDGCRAAVDEVRLALAGDTSVLDQAVRVADACALP
jgi:hypothetical protein